MRVLHLLNDVTESGNGIVNSTVDLACEQAARGLEVHVASGPGGYTGLLSREGVTTHRLAQDRRPANVLPLLAAFRRLLALEPDIVHVHNLTGCALATSWPRKRSRTVATVHLEDKTGVRLMTRADQLVVFSKQAARRMTRLGAEPGRVHVVRQGSIHGARSRHAATRAMSRPTLRHPAVLCVAGLYEHKGLYDLLSAFAVVRAAVPDAHLYYVGAGPEDGRLQQAVDDAALSADVTLVGFQSNVTPWLEEADVLVLASHTEPAGLVLMEARATATPVVATRVDGIPTLVDDGVSGLLVPPRDPAALAAAVLRVVGDDDVRRALVLGSSAGHEDLTVQRFARDVESVYERALQDAR